MMTGEKGKTMEHNLRVCERCRDAIISREGHRPTDWIDIDPETEDSTCEWCELDGFFVLYEFI